MCLIGVAVDAHPDYPLILLANRDEFHARATSAMHWWESDILAGKDEQAGGTWLGLDRSGRIAAVTNYRQLPAQADWPHSRGDIPLQFLNAQRSAAGFVSELAERGNQFNGFNALFGDPNELWWCSNRGGSYRVKRGIHGLSNHLLGTPWPKVRRLTQDIQDAVDRNRISFDQLLPLLQGRRIAEDDALPETGVGIERERMLSATFIVSEGYGTRSSCVIATDRVGKVAALEVNYDTAGAETNRQQFQFQSR